GILFQQRHRGHHLAGLAVTTLRNVFRDPSPLHRVSAIRGEPFYGDDFFSRDRRYRQHAGAHHLTVEMHRAGATQPLPAPELRSAQAEILAHHPEQGLIRLDVERMRLTVDVDVDHRCLLFVSTRESTVDTTKPNRQFHCAWRYSSISTKSAFLK